MGSLPGFHEEILGSGPAAARGRRKLSLCFGGAGALLSAGLKVLEPDGETVRVTCGDALLYAAWLYAAWPRILMAMPLQLSNHPGTSMVCK